MCRCASAREQDSTFTPPASPMTSSETRSISFLDYDDSPKAFVDDWVNETGALPDEGCTLTLNITRECLPSRIAFPDCASWSVPALQVTVEACAHAGFRGTVDGLLDKVRGDIEQMRSGYGEAARLKLDAFLQKISLLQSGHIDTVQMIVRDCSGLAMVDSRSAKSGHVTRETFRRTWSDDETLGVNLPLETAQVTTVEEVAELLKGKKRVCFFTGAGASVESGIPPFRVGGVDEPHTRTKTNRCRDNAAHEDESGESDAARSPNTPASSPSIWGTFDATRMTVQGFNTSTEVAEAWWDMKHSLLPKFLSAAPNPAHLFGKLLADQNRLLGVVTQNIDSLHHVAGVPREKIVELHGHMRGVVCSDKKTILNPIPFRDGMCEYSEDDVSCRAHRYFDGNRLPRCPRCQCPLRTETVMFGQPMPDQAVADAEEMMNRCDILFVVGSSLIVKPANGLPAHAIRRGVPVVIVNLHPTQFDDNVRGLIREPAGAFFGALAQLL